MKSIHDCVLPDHNMHQRLLLQEHLDAHKLKPISNLSKQETLMETRKPSKYRLLPRSHVDNAMATHSQRTYRLTKALTCGPAEHIAEDVMSSEETVPNNADPRQGPTTNEMIMRNIFTYSGTLSTTPTAQIYSTNSFKTTNLKSIDNHSRQQDENSREMKYTKVTHIMASQTTYL